MLLSLFAFIISAAALFFSSQSLLNRLIALFTRLTHSQTTTANLIFFLLLPGVLIHELSHIVTAELLQVPTGRLSLKPSLENNHLKLGSAQISQTDPFRLTLIGSAPFITGTIFLWLLLKFGFGIDFGQFNFLNFEFNSLLRLSNLGFGYLIFAIANTMFSSPSDLQAAIVPIIFILILFGIFSLLKLNLPINLITYLTQTFTLISLVFSATLIVNLIILLPLKLLSPQR